MDNQPAQPLSSEEYSNFLEDLADYLFDYSVPDPAWDYSLIYHRMQYAKKKLEDAIAGLCDLKESNPENDRILKTRLAEICVVLMYWESGKCP